MRRVVSFLALMALIAAGAGAYLYNFVQGPKADAGKPVAVTIKPGSSAAGIAETLERRRVVDSALAFRLYMRLNDVNQQLRAGKYKLKTGQRFPALLAALKKGPPAEFVKLTIPEGLNVEQTATQVEKSTQIKAADFMAAATPSTIRPWILPADATTLEGFLYPTTYFVDKKETAASLVRRMVAEFNIQMQKAGLPPPNNLGRTPYEMLIIASLIEEEAKSAGERDKISAVIHNRLRIGMPLGIDATIQYAVRKYQGQPLTLSDLAIDSPFNTRIRPGLPPYPISSPRISSLRAAYNPAGVDYLYYVLTGDCVTQFFTADYNKFLVAKTQQPTNC